MPIRIKPVQDLGRCLLNLESIKDICLLVERRFNISTYVAEDGYWEISGEPMKKFVDTISNRERLDSFRIVAQCTTSISIGSSDDDDAAAIDEPALISVPDYEIELIFNQEKAELRFVGTIERQSDFEHFLYDIKKHIYPATFSQRFSGLRIPLGIGGIIFRFPQRYCHIIIKQKEPNQTARNIRDNIAASIIYDVFKYVLVFLIGGLALWLYLKYGVSANELLNLPSIPTPTSTP
jgi:hypothetical protein